MKTTIKGIIPVLMLSLAITLFIVPQFAAPVNAATDDPEDNKVAMIVETGEKYTTLEEAVNAASDNQTITILRDCEETTYSYIRKTITIDLGAYTVTKGFTNDSYGILYVSDGGNVTVKGTTGKLYSPGSKAVAVKSYYGTNCSLTLEGGSIIADGEKAIDVQVSRSIVYINGGSVQAKKYALNDDFGGRAELHGGKVIAEEGAAVHVGQAEFSMDGGEIFCAGSGSAGVLLNGNSATRLYLYDGTVAGGSYGVKFEGHDSFADFRGGAVSGGSYSVYSTCVHDDMPSRELISVKNGRFAGAVYADTKESREFISGGVFSVAPDDVYLKNELVPYDNPDPATAEDYPYALTDAVIVTFNPLRADAVFDGYRQKVAPGYKAKKPENPQLESECFDCWEIYENGRSREWDFDNDTVVSDMQLNGRWTTHTWGEPEYIWADDNSTVKASCICSRDSGHVLSETAEVKSEVTRQPTCTEMGETTYTAVFENSEFESQSKTLTDTAADPDAHDWGEWKVVKEATADTEGSRERACKVCGQKETEVIPKKTPDGGEDNVKPAPAPAPGSDPNQKGRDGTAVGPGASAAAAEKAITSMKSDTDPKGSVFSKLTMRSPKQTKNSIDLKWTRVSKAKKYVIYANKCGKGNKPKKIAAVTGSRKTVKKIAGKKLKKGTYYKFIVVALDKNNNVVSTSRVIHVATKGGKVGNHKSVTVKKSVLNKAKKLKKGKSLKLKAKAAAQSKKLKVRKHVGLRYESTNKNIATVSKKGVVKARKKGKCYIYAFAQNGVYKKIRITVK